ncbi:MAG: DUF1289 domain-containing protein [Chloroflexota bacterium]|nr:DUF1289 domain-containing protein [Chloroflexota bacterium]MEC9451149.1 DUF1289 domain-containing protein [Chloroflexota bacterium]MQG04549.1 DUF1289 domain-containing protein [SAR202 cluster bacterium]|tara:strand:- start:867 stop:1064 length:198 start_codon:yes stop_codon:yes gene_type:complete
MTFDFFEKIVSPCINICEYDQSNSYCTGCFRTPNEIAKWFYMTAENRSKIIESIPSRKNILKKIN